MQLTGTYWSFCRQATRRTSSIDVTPLYTRCTDISIGAEQWSHEIHVPQTIEGAFAQGAKEMIVMLPDSKTVHNGSMYSGVQTHR